MGAYFFNQALTCSILTNTPYLTNQNDIDIFIQTSETINSLSQTDFIIQNMAQYLILKI